MTIKIGDKVTLRGGKTVWTVTSFYYPLGNGTAYADIDSGKKKTAACTNKLTKVS